MTNKPSKQDFVDLINELTGEQTFTKQELEKFMTGARKSLDKKGMLGFFDYIRSSLNIDLSDRFMHMLTNKLRNTKAIGETLKEYNLPIDLIKKQN